MRMDDLGHLAPRVLAASPESWASPDQRALAESLANLERRGSPVPLGSGACQERMARLALRVLLAPLALPVREVKVGHLDLLASRVFPDLAVPQERLANQVLRVSQVKRARLEFQVQGVSVASPASEERQDPRVCRAHEAFPELPAPTVPRVRQVPVAPQEHRAPQAFRACRASGERRAFPAPRETGETLARRDRRVLPARTEAGV